MRIAPLALAVTAAAPQAAVESLATTAAVSLWVFAIDDIFDERLVPIDLLRARCRRYAQIARGDPVGPVDQTDPMEQALRAVIRKLARFRLFARLRPYWAAALTRTLEGMQFEDAVRRHFIARRDPDVLPSYDAYLAQGLNSIGAPAHTATVLLTSDDPSVVPPLADIADLERDVAICIRLANDLRSFEREREDGAVNSLLILQRDLVREGVDPERAWAVARTRVSEAIDAALGRAQRRAAGIETDTGEAESAILRIGEVVTAFYRAHDFHTYPAAAAHG